MAQAATGGGVWRLKWHPSADRPDSVAAACMRAGVQLFDVVRGGGEGEDGALLCARSPSAAHRLAAAGPGLLRRVQYMGHGDETLSYGCDWVPGASPEGADVLATCSFYNHEFRVWEAVAGPNSAG